MKINKDIRFTAEGTRQDVKNGNIDEKFQDLVIRQNEKLQTAQLSILIKNIDDAGNRLGRSQTIKDLTKFKSLVKQFVKEAVGYGLKLKKDESWDQFGQGRDLKVVQVIDEKLIELTEEVMNKEKSGLTILDKVGEIKGMLINLYT
ncbi:YaaR family protein [Niallia sp. 03133]|uniref:YaaR family protein n=1 Tax=Niallia sp. 03133 TaxID=3458060 RepID=UPI004043F922